PRLRRHLHLRGLRRNRGRSPRLDRRALPHADRGGGGMNDVALFPPTNEERLAALERFLTDERKHRESMSWLHPEKRQYWAQRIAQADEMLAHVTALKEAIA